MHASSKKDFKVAPTVGKIAEGPNSLLSLNEKIMAVTDPSNTAAVFDPMWHLCLACATKRKLIAKVRGDSNDFLTYATIGYVQRWQKQFSAPDARRPVQEVQNWIPYILGTIRFALMAFNKDAYDYNFLPLPKLFDAADDCESGSDKDIRDFAATNPLVAFSLSELATTKTLHAVLEQLPKELWPYRLDILFYLRSLYNSPQGTLITKDTENFVITGKAIFSELVDDFVFCCT